jgi:hypothetical protein
MIMANFFSGALNGIKNTASDIIGNTKSAYRDGGMKGVGSAIGGNMQGNMKSYGGGALGGALAGGYSGDSALGMTGGAVGGAAMGAGVGGLARFAQKNWGNLKQSRNPAQGDLFGY